ncbi:RNA-binding protein squid-like isoform X7 [Neocloeon triangulifer]|uniref:RNA-binding protein squid-like isoform X7 n=1 Tax=Neocloeon triangulifer TaxID=2078957 RepID=UPI00286EBA34|nr:RNA-binding protein squid-like isoform X7 [Neocloeon triangulifer]
MADQDYDASGNGDFQEDMGGECDNLESEDALLNGAENGGGETQLQQQGESSGSGRDDDRKLFVGGLSWETTDKELREHFSKFGDIESINVKTDPNTGRSRGFAFIVFGTAEGLEKALNAGDHVINNKKVDPKKAKARHGKIFVGGLPTELSDEDIKSFFSAFGTIMEVEMPFDKIKNQRKGFCFITFESDQVVQELLKTPKQTINGKEVDVKKATPRPENMGGMRGGRGGRGGPRGGRGGRGGRGRGGGGGYGGGYDYYGSGYGNYGGYGGGYDYTGYNYGNYEQS